jgi:acetate---CoA ligase (ADP-forming)
MTTVEKHDGIARLLDPRNVVLVGASDRPGHWSKRVWDNLQRFGFAGRVLPVNPNRSEIWGAPCFASLAALPETPDHLAIYTPAETTLQILREGAAAGAKSATIYAAGFGEGGDEDGRRRGADLRQVFAETGLTALGPNCMGVACGRSNFCTIPDETLQPLGRSPVAVISQSGALCASINRAINELGLQVGYLISCGNQIGRSIADFIDYFAGDAEVRVLLCYIEAVPDAARFLEAARRARANGKVVVAVKIGGSDAARASALAHTGSLAGRAEVFNAYASAAGIVRLASLEDAIEAVEFLARAPLPRGHAIAAVTNSGALRSLITEAADRTGAALAALSPSTREALVAALDQPDADNPLDTKRTIPAEQYAACLKALVTAPEVDIVLAAEELPREEGIERRIANLRALADAQRNAEAIGKTVTMVVPLPVGTTSYGRKVKAQMPHLPVLRDTEKSLRVMRALADAGTRPIHNDAFFPPPANTLGANALRARAAGLAGPAALNEVESKALLRAYGIAVPPETVADTASDAAAAAETIGFPVVLKAVSAALPHKSDAGLVILNVRDRDTAVSAAHTLLERCRALGVSPDGILVAKQMPAGIETVIGITRDVEMGPAVMVGLGGIFVELVKDVAFAPACLDRERALAMIQTTRAGRLLEGFRGKAGDRRAVADALVNLGRLASDLADIVEAVDINPFVVYEHGAFALDALVVLQPPRAHAENN